MILIQKMILPEGGSGSGKAVDHTLIYGIHQAAARPVLPQVGYEGLLEHAWLTENKLDA
jgi:hypothetical protein